MKSIVVAAIIAAACSGVALAGEVKQEQSAVAPAVKAQVMSDSEMDKVTAGVTPTGQLGFGRATACEARGGVVCEVSTLPGFGQCHAPGRQPCF